MAVKPGGSSAVKKTVLKKLSSKDSLKQTPLKSVVKKGSTTDGKEKGKEVEKPKVLMKDGKDGKGSKSPKKSVQKEKPKKKEDLKKVEPDPLKTPPVKRVRFKSPQAEAERGGAGKKRSELRSLAKLSNVVAELDGAGLSDFLEFIKDQNPQNTAVEALVAAAAAKKGKVVDPKKEGNKLLKHAIQKARHKKEVAAESEPEAEEEDEDEASAAESEAEEEKGDEEESEDGEGEGEEDVVENDQEGEGEEEESGEEDAVVEEEPPKDTLAVAAEATEANGKTMRNSVTDKAAWDKFTRDAVNRKVFPSKLYPEFTRNKINLFNLWLDAGRDWTQTEVLVEREHSNETLSRKQMNAVKAKNILKEYGDEKGKELIKKRRESGLWYPDDDYPTDEMEAWIYMPVGRMLREDQIVKESMKARGKTQSDKAMMDALTGADGILSAGALPGVKAASEEGQKKLLQMMDDENKPVKKAPKVKNKEDETKTETVKPKTTHELVAERMQAILDEGGTARKRGMRLKGFDYATELSQSLLKHARMMEQWYDTLQGALTCSPKKPEKFFIDAMAQINLKRKWYEEAQETADSILKPKKAKKPKKGAEAKKEAKPKS